MPKKPVSQRLESFTQRTEKLRSDLKLPSAKTSKAKGGRARATKHRACDHKPIKSFQVETAESEPISKAEQQLRNKAQAFLGKFGTFVSTIDAESTPKEVKTNMLNARDSIDAFITLLPSMVEQFSKTGLSGREKQALNTLTEQLEHTTQAWKSMRDIGNFIELARDRFPDSFTRDTSVVNPNQALKNAVTGISKQLREISSYIYGIFGKGARANPETIKDLNKSLKNLNKNASELLTIIKTQYHEGELTNLLEKVLDGMPKVSEAIDSLLSKRDIQETLSTLFDKQGTLMSEIDPQLTKVAKQQIATARAKIAGTVILSILLCLTLVFIPIVGAISNDLVKKNTREIKEMKGSLNNIKLLLENALVPSARDIPSRESFDRLFKYGITTREIKVKNKKTQETETKAITPIVDNPYINEEKNTLLHQLAYSIAIVDDDEASIDFLVENVLLHSIILAENDSEKAPEELKKYLTLKNTDGEMFVDILPPETKVKLLKKLGETTIGFSSYDARSLHDYLPPALVKALE